MAILPARSDIRHFLETMASNQSGIAEPEASPHSQAHGPGHTRSISDAEEAARAEQEQIALREEISKRVRHRVDGKSTYFGMYVSHEGSANLLTYQYHGVDNSLIYKHILTPMNNYLMTHVPVWLAPNVITLTGLLLVTFTHILFFYYCPFLEGQAPTWLYVLSAVTLFSYQTLDNLDGKQARRTRTSSPLGLLFDHGCDAINVSVSTITTCCVIQLGTTWKSLVFVAFGQLAFVCATWEEYYTGSLELPIINGPTEGILIGIALNIITAFAGPDFWLRESLVSGIPNNSMFMYITIFSGILTVISNTVNVLRAVRVRNDSIPVAFTRLIPFCFLNLFGILWVLISPTDIFAVYPRLFLWMLGFLNSKLVLHLMLAHLCGEEYHPFRKTLVPLFYVAAHCGFCMLEDVYEAINEALILKEFFFISLVAYMHIVLTVSWEVKTVLGVPVFTVPLKNQQDTLAHEAKAKAKAAKQAQDKKQH